MRTKPTEDCVFTDPMKEGVLKLHNYGKWGQAQAAGGVAVYNLTDREQSFKTGPSQIPELAEGEYWVYDFLAQAVVQPAKSTELVGSLKAGDYKWYVFLSKGRNSSCLGISDKYAGFTAVEASFTEGNTDTVVLRGTGKVSWISERKPISVMEDGRDKTERMISKGLLYTISLPESIQKTVIAVNWA